jgi:hypothetical protein
MRLGTGGYGIQVAALEGGNVASNLQGSGEQPASLDLINKLKVEEYKALRAEIAANTEKMYTITQYVVLLSAVVYAFLLGFEPEHVTSNTVKEFTNMPFLLRKIVWSIPTAVSCFGGLLTFIIAHVSFSIGKYISDHLEPPPGGWEKHLKNTRGHIIFWVAPAFAWILLIGANATALWFGIHYLNSQKT